MVLVSVLGMGLRFNSKERGLGEQTLVQLHTGALGAMVKVQVSILIHGLVT
tara:strand:- start:3640 stop:3792 length:153 start_codon:yes stop_codon:yes gene_type:complete